MPGTFLKFLTRFTSLLLVAGGLCSCATSGTRGWSVKINTGAGNGELMIVPVTLPDGIARPFALDTGACRSLFDKSLVAALGPQVDTNSVWHFGKREPFNEYRSPALRIHGHVLKSAEKSVGVLDVKTLLPTGMYSILGIVGMDYLGSNCLKLDFKTKRMEFLPPPKPGATFPGKSVPLRKLEDGCFVIDQNLAGVEGSPSLLDSGFDWDGWLLPDNFSRWTNVVMVKTNEAQSPEGIFKGERYPHLALEGIQHEVMVSGDPHLIYNGLGLAFLARHTVWMDFPNNTLYLKRNTTESPLFLARQQIARRTAGEAMEALVKLHKAGRLPDWSAKDKPVQSQFNFDVTHPDRVNLGGVQKRGSAMTYDYVLTRENGTEWKLKEAGRTDAQGHRTELPVPR